MVKVQRIDDARWRIPREHGMRVDGIVYASAEMMDDIRQDKSLEQVANVAHLPGILRASIAMPDIHWGYGFPIGGVAGIDAEDGVISPGGVGYDINCGVRLLRSNLSRDDLRDALVPVVEALFRNIPTGVGRGRAHQHLGRDELRSVLRRGAAWAVERGLGEPRDLERSRRTAASRERTRRRCRITPSRAAPISSARWARATTSSRCSTSTRSTTRPRRALRPRAGHRHVMIHSGSRGLGHQVCTDHLKTMLAASSRYGIELPDRQLCCAPIRSPEGERYLGAMAAAANFAFANRQVMTHWVRESFAEAMGGGAAAPRIDVVYDVCHNIAKFETSPSTASAAASASTARGRRGLSRRAIRRCRRRTARWASRCSSRATWGATRSCSPAPQRAYDETFGSTCHGAGRRMSRGAAKKAARGRRILDELAERGVVVRAAGLGTVVEEMPEAYKDVADVVDVVERAGISRKVARLRPMGVIKG